MKVLKIIGILITALLVIFFLIGLFNPLFEYGNTISINAPGEKVWSVYTTGKSQWVDGFQSQTLVRGNTFEAGSEYTTIIISGEEMVMHEKITSINPGKRIEWLLDNDVLISAYSYEFTGDSIKTEVKTRYQVEGKNVFMKSVLYLSKGYLKSSDADMLSALKKTAENEN